MSEELVLLVVDDSADRELLETSLRGAGYAVESAESSQAGARVLNGREPDLVLVDLSRRPTAGAQDHRALRELSRSGSTPFIYVVAAADPELQQVAFDSGADDLLVKPIERTELLFRVRSLLRLSRGERLLAARNAELLRLQRQKDELGALLVHELRNPLAAIMTNASYLLEVGVLQGDDEQALRDVVSAAESMTRMLMNLVDLHRSEDGLLPLRVELIEPGRLIRDVTNVMRRRAAERSHRLRARIEGEVPSLRGDYELLRRVLENLADNSFRYAPKGDEITIECRAVDHLVEISVRDHGPGIPEHLRERIFEKYVQLGDDATRASRGLGLAYCKAVVEAHGGTITAESPEQGGALFRVRLPLSPAQRRESTS